MKPLLHVCCSEIIRDAETNAISLINVLEEINGLGFPLLIPQFCIHLLSEREEREANTYEVRLKILNNETEVFSGDVKIDFQDKLRTRNNIKFAGFAVMLPGKLHVRFENDGKIFSEIILPARQISAKITN